MRRQLLRAAMVVSLCAAGAFAVHETRAQDNSQNTDNPPAQLDRTYGNDRAMQNGELSGTGGAGMGTGMEEGTGGSGGVGAKATRMKHDAGMAMDGGMMMRDAGMGGAGAAGMRDAGMPMDGGTRGTMRGAADAGTGGAGTSGAPGETMEDERSRQNEHTNIIIYGPNGVPARNGQAQGGTRTPTTHGETGGTNEGTGGAGNMGTPGTGTGEDTNTTGDQGPHTNVDVYGPNGQ